MFRLSSYRHNIMQFYNCSIFQKSIISILTGLRIQQDELKDLRRIFEQLDVD